MKELSFEKMEKVHGGSCGSQIAGGFALVVGFAVASGPIGWVAFGVSAAAYAWAVYDEGDACAAYN